MKKKKKNKEWTKDLLQFGAIATENKQQYFRIVITTESVGKTCFSSVYRFEFVATFIVAIQSPQLPV